MGKMARVSEETFDEFFEGQGTLAASEEMAIKRVLAWQIAKEKRITKTVMAKRMRADRRQLDRLLAPSNPSVTLGTLRRVAAMQ